VDDAWFVCFDQELQRVEDHCALLGRGMGFAQWVAQWPLHEERTRHADRLCQIFGDGDRDRRDSCSFDYTGYQSHGPITEASARGKEGKIDAICAQFCRYFGRNLVQ
jgi:hypothetical protein